MWTHPKQRRKQYSIFKIIMQNGFDDPKGNKKYHLHYDGEYGEMFGGCHTVINTNCCGAK